MTSSIYPPVVVVDENDHEIGTAMLDEVLHKGLYHRIVAIFVIDDRGHMLLQLRGPNVKLYPNCWDQAAGGHVDAGQTYQQAAANELTEELGLHKLNLTTMGTHRTNTQDGPHVINQFERVYQATIPHDTVLKPQLSELTGLRWFTPAELKQLIAQQLSALTPGLLYDLRHYFPAFSQ